MRRSCILALSFIICHSSFSPAGAQTLTSVYQPGVTADGAVYYLPKTAVRVTVQVEKETYTPGDFSKYAQRYLRLNNVSTEPSTAYRVVGLKQEPVGMADATKAFAVKFDIKTVAANVTLSDDGCLLAINEPAAAPAPLVASAGAAPAGGSQPVTPRQFMNEEILAAGSVAKMAELTAQEIYDIRENRSLLIKGQADFMPKDGEQLRLMLGQLDMQDRALTSLFAGVTVRDTTEHVIVLCPEAPVSQQVLFRLSQLRGLVDADDLSGIPYYINIEDLKTVPDAAQQDAGKKKKLSDKGIYVNVPSKMRSTISCGIDPVDVQEMPAPQFGHVELLSDGLFNKRYTTHLRLSSVSGAVEQLQADQPKK